LVWIGDNDTVGAGGYGPVPETQRFLGLLTLGYVLVGDDSARGTVAGKASHPSDKPTLLGRGMTRVLERELLSLARENRTDPLRECSGVYELFAYRRLADSEVVGAFRNVSNSTVGCSELSPGLVDENDDARLLKDRYMRREAV
jgi:hypothetical protein